jgi:hypothetical protein
MTAFLLKECNQTVGAGLLAKAVDQSAEILNGQPPSLASQLPQVFVFA